MAVVTLEDKPRLVRPMSASGGAWTQEADCEAGSV